MHGFLHIHSYTHACAHTHTHTRYEDHGKYLTKKNTFHDFIDCAKHLNATNRTSPQLLGITGRSAGGLLMGAVLNMAPDQFKVR